jgi:hypothetical protein
MIFYFVWDCSSFFHEYILSIASHVSTTCTVMASGISTIPSFDSVNQNGKEWKTSLFSPNNLIHVIRLGTKCLFLGQILCLFFDSTSSCVRSLSMRITGVGCRWGQVTMTSVRIGRPDWGDSPTLFEGVSAWITDNHHDF